MLRDSHTRVFTVYIFSGNTRFATGLSRSVAGRVPLLCYIVLCGLYCVVFSTVTCVLLSCCCVFVSLLRVCGGLLYLQKATNSTATIYSSTAQLKKASLFPLPDSNGVYVPPVSWLSFR